MIVVSAGRPFFGFRDRVTSRESSPSLASYVRIRSPLSPEPLSGLRRAQPPPSEKLSSTVQSPSHVTATKTDPLSGDT